MKFAIYKTSGRALKKAGAAVSKNGGISGGFTLLELMVVIVIIGILATLAYSSLMDVIFTSRAKETAQTIRTFTERALMDAKRQNKEVRICITTGSNAMIISEDPGTTTACSSGNRISSETLSQGFLRDSSISGVSGFKNIVKSENRIGLSGVSGDGYFAACGFKGYCGGAVKKQSENSFRAYIRKGTNANWGPL